MDLIYNDLKGLTKVIISHNKSNLDKCDQVYEIKKGSLKNFN